MTAFHENPRLFEQVMALPAIKQMVLDAAEEIQPYANYTTKEGEFIPASVIEYQTDRPHAVVGLIHPAGANIEAKTGHLVKAAGDAGFRVSPPQGG